jgi:hypothetical protein
MIELSAPLTKVNERAPDIVKNMLKIRSIDVTGEKSP